jgi:hypothetical protein
VSSPRADALIATRCSWHAVAEHVLGAARYAADGHIGLRPSPGGFCTPPHASIEGERQLLVVGSELLVSGERGERRHPLTTLREVAHFAGVVAGAPAELYTPTTPLDLDRPLGIDLEAARQLADWFALTQTALEVVMAEHDADDPAPAQLWPEHFDLATTIGEVNVGGSPGDAEHPIPYLYVGPWTPRSGAFWNEPFGASFGADQVHSVEDALAFLRIGLDLAGVDA